MSILNLHSVAFQLYLREDREGRSYDGYWRLEQDWKDPFQIFAGVPHLPTPTKSQREGPETLRHPFSSSFCNRKAGLKGCMWLWEGQIEESGSNHEAMENSQRGTPMRRYPQKGPLYFQLIVSLPPMPYLLAHLNWKCPHLLRIYIFCSNLHCPFFLATILAVSPCPTTGGFILPLLSVCPAGLCVWPRPELSTYSILLCWSKTEDRVQLEPGSHSESFLPNAREVGRSCCSHPVIRRENLWVWR